MNDRDKACRYIGWKKVREREREKEREKGETGRGKLKNVKHITGGVCVLP